MISTSTAFQNALAQSSREWRARFLYNDTDTGATTKSLTVKGGSMDESVFNLCGVYSTSFEAVIDTLDGFLWEDKEIIPQLGLVLENNEIEWISLGLFTVTEVYSAKYQTTIKGVGRLTAKCGGQFVPPSTPTILNIQRAIATQAGVQTSRDTSLPASLRIEKDLSGLTMLEVWQVVASTLGAIVWERNDGVIRISKYPNTPNLNVGTDRMTEEPTFSDYDNVITGTHVIVQEASVDEDGNPIPAIEYSTEPYNVTMYNPYMTETAYTTFNGNLTGLTWRKATVPLALGDPRLQPNDMLAVTVDGDTYNVPCHNYIHQFDGGLKTIVTANGDSESLEKAQNEGSITRQLKEIVADIITAKEAILGRVKADELEADVVRIFNTLSVAKHFFVDSSGYVHITENENDYTTGFNILIDNDSIDVRDGTTTLASFSINPTIGDTTGNHIAIDSDSVDFKSGSTLLAEITQTLLKFYDRANDGFYQFGNSRMRMERTAKSGFTIDLNDGNVQAYASFNDGVLPPGVIEAMQTLTLSNNFLQYLNHGFDAKMTAIFGFRNYATIGAEGVPIHFNAKMGIRGYSTSGYTLDPPYAEIALNDGGTIKKLVSVSFDDDNGGLIDISLDTSLTDGDDYWLYQAITDLGWQSEVIV